MLVLGIACLLFIGKLDELNYEATESSSNLTNNLLVVSIPRLNHPTSKLKRNYHHYCLRSSSHLIINQAIIWLSPVSDKSSNGVRNCRCMCLCTYLGFSVGERQRTHKKSHHYYLRKSGLYHRAGRVLLDMGK